jgi:hypothetical protein
MLDRRYGPPILKQASDVVTDIVSERVEASNPAEP